MKRAVIGSSTFRGFAFEKFETFVVDLMDPDSLSPSLRSEYKHLYQTYRIMTDPTVLLVTPENEEIGRVEGYDKRGPQLYVEKLEELVGES